MKHPEHTLILSINNKGGVGKTTNASALAQWLSARKIPVNIVDADYANASLRATHGEAVEYVARETSDSTGTRKFDRLYEASIENAVVLADLPATSHQDFFEWAREVDLLDQAVRDGIKVVLLVSVTAEHYTLSGLVDLRQEYGQRVTYLVAVSRIHGDPVDFNGRPREDLLAEGTDVIDIPKLDGRVLAEVKRRSTTVSDAIANGWLSLLDSNRARRWLASIFEQLDSCRCLKHLYASSRREVKE